MHVRYVFNQHRSTPSNLFFFLSVSSFTSPRTLTLAKCFYLSRANVHAKSHNLSKSSECDSFSSSSFSFGMLTQLCYPDNAESVQQQLVDMEADEQGEAISDKPSNVDGAGTAKVAQGGPKKNKKKSKKGKKSQKADDEPGCSKDHLRQGSSQSNDDGSGKFNSSISDIGNVHNTCIVMPKLAH